eukprot:6584538-Prymnesium_polylepis.1
MLGSLIRPGSEARAGGGACTVCVRSMIRVLFLLAAAETSYAKVVDYQADAGAVPCEKTFWKSCDSKTSDAEDNTAKMNTALAALAPGDVLKVPNATYL